MAACRRRASALLARSRSVRGRAAPRRRCWRWRRRGGSCARRRSHLVRRVGSQLRSNGDDPGGGLRDLRDTPRSSRCHQGDNDRRGSGDRIRRTVRRLGVAVTVRPSRHPNVERGRRLRRSHDAPATACRAASATGDPPGTSARGRGTVPTGRACDSRGDARPATARRASPLSGRRCDAHPCHRASACNGCGSTHARSYRCAGG